MNKTITVNPFSCKVTPVVHLYKQHLNFSFDVFLNSCFTGLIPESCLYDASIAQGIIRTAKNSALYLIIASSFELLRSDTVKVISYVDASLSSRMEHVTVRNVTLRAVVDKLRQN